MSSQTACGSGVRAKKARSQGTDTTVEKAMAIAAISRWRRGLSGHARIVSTHSVTANKMIAAAVRACSKPIPMYATVIE